MGRGNLGFERVDQDRQRGELLLVLERQLPLFDRGRRLVSRGPLRLGRPSLGHRLALGLGDQGGLLPQPVGVAADVFLQAVGGPDSRIAGACRGRPGRLEDQQAGGDIVEEGAVVADHQHGAAELHQPLLEQFERLRVEVVGRLVEHDHIGGLGEVPCQKHAVAFATGKKPHR